MKGSNAFKATRTTRYLMGTTSSQGFDGIRKEMIPPSPADHVFVPRLGFVMTPKEDYDIAELCNGISNHLNDALFFCDTSLFDDRTDDRLWLTLLQSNGKIVLIPSVLHELEPWLSTHKDHIVAKAILNKDSCIEFGGLDASDAEQHANFAYYVNLLGIRKRVLRLRIIEFERINGRSPDENEITKMKEEIHQTYNSRGYLLANKGAKAEGAPNFYTDEALVFLAVLTGISTGRKVMILSKDEDIQEQFYKLLWLLDTHYRGMLLADLFSSDPSRFTSHPLPKSDPALEDAFTGENNFLIERSDELLEEMLPESFSFVGLYCWIVGEKLTQTTFGAEQEMARLLGIKAKTGGLNTDKLDGRNCHIWLAPLDVSRKLRACAAIVQDKRLELKSSTIAIPILDVNQAIFCGERFKHLVENNP